jgi:hypothetical protein
MEMNMPPRWGFSSFEVSAYKDVAPPELKNGSSAAALIVALMECSDHSLKCFLRDDRL